MEHKIVRYLRHHIMQVAILVLLSFIVLFLGEFYLFRQIKYVNKMVAEGFMQIKEASSQTLQPTVALRR